MTQMILMIIRYSPEFFRPKSFILIESPLGENNKTKSKYFLMKFRFTKDRFEVAIKWKTR